MALRVAYALVRGPAPVTYDGFVMQGRSAANTLIRGVLLLSPVGGYRLVIPILEGDRVLTRRPITQSSAGPDSQWVIEGTLIRIADIQRDVAANGGHAKHVYRAMGLTSAEIAAALAFKFPAIRQMRLETSLVDVTIHCECGDHTRVIASETDNVEITCICGRTWVVPLCATPGKPPAPSDISEP